MRVDQTDVLVAGAGPVGLLTAIFLAEAGVKVAIIDREERTTSRSYACALHPRTLRLLDRAGVATELLSAGRKLGKVAFYEGQARKAEVTLANVSKDYPFVLIVSQAQLEGVLERHLRKLGGHVFWRHRFDDFTETSDEIVTAVEKLGGTSTGYIIPHWETVVLERFELRSRFLVGTDGHNSLVRRRLQVDSEHLSGPDYFTAYEFESDSPGEDEVRVVLDDTTTNVLWPLSGNRRRWTFQMIKSDMEPDFPEKERHVMRLEQKQAEEDIRQYVQKVGHRRAPWFKDPVVSIEWCTNVVFEHSVVKSFGQGRCWLAGDAAHQTGPVGAQSMNVGMLEAESLAKQLNSILSNQCGLESLQTYNNERQQEWASLLQIGQRVVAANAASDWVKTRADRLLACLPASGDELQALAGQLGLRLPVLAAK